LKSLGLHFQSESIRSGLGVPIHKGGINFEDFVAVPANDLGLKVFVLFIGGVVFVVFADVDFPENVAFNEDGEGAVNGGSGNGVINLPCQGEQFLGGVVVVVFVDGFKYGSALIGKAQVFLGEECLKCVEVLLYVGHRAIWATDREYINCCSSLRNEGFKKMGREKRMSGST